MENIIEINGVKYSEKKPKEIPRGVSSRLFQTMAMVAFLGGDFGFGGGHSRKRPNVDIVEEYSLIQQKKSNLSRSDRDWVVRVFESNYTRVK